MASVSMNSRNGNGCKCDMKKALYGIPMHNYRTSKNHSNKDIDASRTHLNKHYGPQTVEEFRERLRSIIAECDRKHPPMRKKQDRKVLLEIDIVSPREGMSPEDELRWSEATDEVIHELFGDLVVGGTYHADEIHWYTPPGETEQHLSRGHTHWSIIPWTDEHGLNMDNFYKRGLPNRINAALDKKCKEMFGFPFRDGSQQKSRGDVERMKLESTKAEREQAANQVAEYDQIIEMQQRTIQQQDKQMDDAQQALQDAQEKAEKLQVANNAMEAKNKDLESKAAVAEQRANIAEKQAVKAAEKAEAMERKAASAEQKLAKAESAFSRFMARVSEWVDAHTGLQRIFRAAWRLSEPHRDKIESRMEQTVNQGEKAILGASESLESLLAAEQEVEQGTRVFGVLKKAVKEDLDADELLADDEWER